MVPTSCASLASQRRRSIGSARPRAHPPQEQHDEEAARHAREGREGADKAGEAAEFEGSGERRALEPATGRERPSGGQESREPHTAGGLLMGPTARCMRLRPYSVCTMYLAMDYLVVSLLLPAPFGRIGAAASLLIALYGLGAVGFLWERRA